MSLAKEQGIKIIMMIISGSSSNIAAELNRKHGTNITHNTVAKAIVNFEELDVPKI